MKRPLKLISALLGLLARVSPPASDKHLATPSPVQRKLQAARYSRPANTGPLPCSWSKRNQCKVRKNFRRALAAG